VIPHDSYRRGVSRFPFLAKLTDIDRQRVVETGSIVLLDGGTTLFDVGDACSGLGLVIDGCVRVSCVSQAGRELVLYRVRPGQTCTVTASCLVSEEPYPAMGVLEVDTTALIMPKEIFRTLLGDSEVFRDFVFDIFTARIDHLMELVNDVAFNKLDVRLASRLIELGPVIEKTHQDLADEIGSTREMVSRILESFADQGILALGRKRIEIQDPEKIQHLAHSR
jgi:CRP/FNR family transcriptional regulator